MQTKKILAQMLLTCAAIATCCTAQDSLEISTRLEVGDSTSEPMLVYEVKNPTDKPIKADEIGVGSSPIYTRSPKGTSGYSSIIVEWNEGQGPPPLAAGQSFRSSGSASESLGCPVGLYITWLKVQGKDTEKVALYREPELPCVDVRFGEDMDSIRVVADLVKQGDFEIAQRQRRQAQLEAFEGMKQYVMANPYILALSADGKPGFRLKLMATNNTQNALELPKLNTPKNRLEIEGFNKDDIWSYPRYPLQDEPGKDVSLQIGETRSWVEDIGRYIKENGIRRPGRYVVHWILDDKEVANFVFYLPEPKTEKAQVK